MRNITDCLIIGFNDVQFDSYVHMVASMGKDSGAYRDLKLAFLEYNCRPYHALGILNYFYFESKDKNYRPFHNTDLLWPAILYLGTYLWRRGFTFDYINSFQLEKSGLREKLLRNDVLSVAITTTVYITPDPIIEIISFIREYNEKVKIIVGGPYIMNQARQMDPGGLQRLFKYIGADIYVISEEGEAALCNVLNALRCGGCLEAIHNIAHREGEVYVVSRSSKEENSLDENIVNYSLFPKEHIGELISIGTAKSCPFACAFCGFPQRAGTYRYLSVDLVERALNAISDIGTVTTLTFLDDTFNVPPKRFKDILKMMIRNNYGFRWNSFYRCDYGDEETIRLMKDAGCEGVFLGIESGADSMLKMMNKAARRKDYLKAIDALKKAGILTHASFIIGFPGETYESVGETIQFIEETQPDFFRTQLWYCDPVTPIWNRREEYGIRGAGFNWSHKTMDFLTACDLIDEIFLSIENAVWMPQYGFELWSIFYLQRKGMSLSQVKAFVRCFNAVIRDKLVSTEREHSDPRLVEILAQSCRFDSGIQPDMGAVEAVSGAAYGAAETFWAGEFCSGTPRCNIESEGFECDGGASGDVMERLAAPLLVVKSVLDAAREQSSGDLFTVTLAAYSILLSRLNGREENVIVSASEGSHPMVVPLRLYPSWKMSFLAFVMQVRERLAQAARHERYAFHILRNERRMAEFGCSCPTFDVGYLFCGEGNVRDGLGVSDHPRVVRGLKMTLEVIETEDDAKIDFLFDRKTLRAESVERFGSYLVSVLEQGVKNPDVPLSEITLMHDKRHRQMLAEGDAAENFHF